MIIVSKAPRKQVSPVWVRSHLRISFETSSNLWQTRRIRLIRTQRPNDLLQVFAVKEQQVASYNRSSSPTPVALRWQLEKKCMGCARLASPPRAIPGFASSRPFVLQRESIATRTPFAILSCFGIRHFRSQFADSMAEAIPVAG